MAILVGNHTKVDTKQSPYLSLSKRLIRVMHTYMEFENNQVTNELVMVSTSEKGEAVVAILVAILLSIDKTHI